MSMILLITSLMATRYATAIATYLTGTFKGCTSQSALERQDLSCTYVAPRDMERDLIMTVQCRITALGLVPIAPAQCCKTCLSKTIHPLDSCSDLNFCSGHGVCNLGSCDCLDGFGGPDCSSQIGGAAGQLPQWATSLIIFGSCVLVTTLVLVAGRVVHHFADRHAEDEEDEEGLGEPLILRIDHDDQGSVGSEDTTGFDSDDDMPPVEAEAVGGGVLIPESSRDDAEETEVQSFVVPVANGIQLETRRRTRQQPTHAAQDVGVTDSEDEAETAEDLERIEAAATAINQGLPQSPVTHLQDEIQEATDSASFHEAPTEDVVDNADDLVKDAKKDVLVGSQESEEDPTASLLRGAECNVCMNRPVQVAPALKLHSFEQTFGQQLILWVVIQSNCASCCYPLHRASLGLVVFSVHELQHCICCPWWMLPWLICCTCLQKHLNKPYCCQKIGVVQRMCEDMVVHKVTDSV
ncbi:TPA: hypothetical protein ACH3X1_003879 [Trebouxia sp. C0004]